MSRAQAQDRHKAKMVRKKAERKAYWDERIAQRVRLRLRGPKATFEEYKGFWEAVDNVSKAR